jgi:hypothetical protein
MKNSLFSQMSLSRFLPPSGELATLFVVGKHPFSATKAFKFALPLKIDAKK